MRIFFLMFVSFLLVHGHSVHAQTLHIAAASNFQHTLKQLHADFGRKHAIPLTASFASSGKLFAQIRHGAPYDVFLSADSDRPEKLITLGLAEPASRFTYAEGALVLWSPTAGRFSDQASAEQFLASGSRRMALANPRLAPYGLAARRVADTLHLGAQTITAESIAQAFHFTLTGSVDAGFIAHAQVLQWRTAQPRADDSLWRIDPALHTPIRQQAVLLKRAVNNMQAQTYLDYLQSPAARAIIQAAGYRVSPDNPADTDAP